MINANLRSMRSIADVPAARTAPSISAKTRSKSTATERAATTKGQCTLVEFTMGADPDRLLMDAVSRVNIPALREFLTSVVHEPEIYLALTTAALVPMNASAHPSTHPGPAIRLNQPSVPARSSPIQVLRRAGETAAYGCACGAEEQDVLFVATLLQGAQQLLVPIVLGDSTVEDVMFTLVRRPLHRLDDHAPRCSRLLRLALGWGCADEIDDFYVPRLQIAVQRALTQVVFIPATRSLLTSGHHCNPRLRSSKGTEQCPA